jgi:cobalt-precorrin 5A hydrolase
MTDAVPALVAGIGCRAMATQDHVLAALDAALAVAGRGRDAVRTLAVADFRADVPGVRDAATALALPLATVGPAALDAAASRALTGAPLAARRPLSSSPAEAAALAVAGPAARLLGPRVAVGPATCALAEAGA